MTKMTSTTRDTEAIEELFSKLKDLVPYMPKNKKLSKLEIIQYVIDYIFDLENALESRQDVSGAAAAMMDTLAASTQSQNVPFAPSSKPLNHNHTSHHQLPNSPMPPFRQPLSTLSTYAGEAVI